MIFKDNYMHIESSTSLRNDYGTISSLAHQARDPIYITNNGEGDLVVLSIEAYEERERLLKHREEVLPAEFSRLSGEKKISMDEMRYRLRYIYSS